MKLITIDGYFLIDNIIYVAFLIPLNLVLKSKKRVELILK